MGWSERGRRPRVSGMLLVVAATLFLGASATSQDAEEPDFESKLPAPLLEEFAQAGTSVAIDGDWAFVGATDGGGGRVHVYHRAAGAWSHTQTIQNPVGTQDFGAALGLTAGTLVVGAPQSVPAGTAHVYELFEDTWIYLQDLIPTGAVDPDDYGCAVALDGDIVVVGSRDALVDGERHGAAYVFRRMLGEFQQEQSLVAEDIERVRRFGAAVAIDGTTVVIGAPDSDGTLGSAHVFDHDGVIWSETQKLIRPVPDLTEDDYFGSSVAIDGALIAVGAEGFDPAGVVDAGSANVFRDIGGNWVHEQQLDAGDPVEYMSFGESIAIDAGRILVGAAGLSGATSATQTDGTAHLFEESGSGSWLETEVLSPSDGSPAAGFAAALSFDDGTAVVGAPFDDVAGFNRGAAYAFLIEKLRTPVFIVPGIAGTYASDPSDDYTWLVNRGIDASAIAVDPLAHAYDDLIQTLQNVGYVMDEDLFVVNYDWRLPPGPIDGTIDGRIDGLSAASLTDEVNSWAVDYLGREMLRALEIWDELHPGRTLSKVDLITHSTGGLVARTYLQCGAYDEPIPGTELSLPEIRNFIMLAVPNRGASKAWNPLHDNWGADIAYKLVLSKIVLRAWKKVLAGGTVTGPGGDITVASLTGDDGPDPIRMVHQYVPTIRGLLATYEFLDTGDGEAQHVNSDTDIRNSFVLDLNNGLGLGNETDNFPFAELCRTSVFYAVGVDTFTTVRHMLGNEGGDDDDSDPDAPAPGADAIVPFTDFAAHDAADDEVWFKDVPVVGGGDGTVPTLSAAGLFFGDDRFIFHELDANGAYPGIDHVKLVSDLDVQSRILHTLGVSHDPEDIHTGLQSTDGQNALSAVWDPVAGFIVDGAGRRLGWSPSTGAVTEIPGSQWFGDGDGSGWVTGRVEEPLHVELEGVGEPHFVIVSVQQGARSGGVIDAGDLATGETRRLDIPIEGPFRNLAVISVKAPKRVKLPADDPRVHKKVKVVVQNRGDTVETIPDATTLLRLVALTIESRGDCPSPDVALAKRPTFPIVLKPGKKLKVIYQATFTCANDPEKSGKTEDHGDFEVTATVSRRPLDGFADAYPADDVCPHPPLGVVTGGKKPIKDKGAGSKGADGRRGAAIVVDVVVK